jgi:hypothetical protein
MHLLATGLHGIQGSQLQMLKIHLTMQASQHWYLVIKWLFLYGAINKQETSFIKECPPFKASNKPPHTAPNTACSFLTNNVHCY